jgi:hypothetical protein
MRMGVPKAPKSTGMVLATRGITTQVNGLKPKEKSSGAMSIAGMPKPAIPSKKLPK